MTDNTTTESTANAPDLPCWRIRCGDLDGSVRATTAEAAFLELVNSHEGNLACIFRASLPNSRSRYYSTETVLRGAGLMD
jgi:hypothetical protein